MYSSELSPGAARPARLRLPRAHTVTEYRMGVTLVLTKGFLRPGVPHRQAGTRYRTTRLCFWRGLDLSEIGTHYSRLSLCPSASHTSRLSGLARGCMCAARGVMNGHPCSLSTLRGVQTPVQARHAESPTRSTRGWTLRDILAGVLPPPLPPRRDRGPSRCRGRLG